MRQVPILPLIDAIKAKIKTAPLTRALAFVDLDEFWSLSTNLSQLLLPCAILEYLGDDCEDFTKSGVVQQEHHFAVNYLDKVASDSSKKRDFLLALSEVKRPFVSGRHLSDILSVDVPGVQIVKTFSPKTEVSNDLKDRNLNWGRIYLDVLLNARQTA